MIVDFVSAGAVGDSVVFDFGVASVHVVCDSVVGDSVIGVCVGNCDDTLLTSTFFTVVFTAVGDSACVGDSVVFDGARVFLCVCVL